MWWAFVGRIMTVVPARMRLWRTPLSSESVVEPYSAYSLAILISSPLCGDDDLQVVCCNAELAPMRTLDVSFGTRETAVSDNTDPLAQQPNPNSDGEYEVLVSLP